MMYLEQNVSSTGTQRGDVDAKPSRNRSRVDRKRLIICTSQSSLIGGQGIRPGGPERATVGGQRKQP